MTLRRPPWEEDPIEYLVSRKFPKLIKPMPLRPLASNNPSPIGPDRQILDQAEAYREELRALSASGLQTLVGEARREDAQRENQRAEAEERKLLFNQPGAKADFAHWASASYWTLDEATALSLGKDPRVVTWGAISPFVRISPFARVFEARRDLFHRAGIMGELNTQTAPSTIIAWAALKKISMPPELVEAVRARGSSTMTDWGRPSLTWIDSEYDKQSSAGLGYWESSAQITPVHDAAPASRGGRPPQYDWDAFTMEIIRRANLPDGLPDKQADLVRDMLSWFQATYGQEPAESAIKARLSKIYRYLEKAKNLEK